MNKTDNHNEQLGPNEQKKNDYRPVHVLRTASKENGQQRNWRIKPPSRSKKVVLPDINHLIAIKLLLFDHIFGHIGKFQYFCAQFLKVNDKP